MHSNNSIFTVLGDTLVLIGVLYVCVEAFSPAKAEAAQSTRVSDGRPKDRVAPAVNSSVSITGKIRSEYSPAWSSLRERAAGRAAPGKAIQAEAPDIRITITGSSRSKAGAVYFQSGVRCVLRHGKKSAWYENSVSESRGSARGVVSTRSCRWWPSSEPWKRRSLSEINQLAVNVPRHSRLK